MAESIPKLARLSKVPLREVWAHEANVFTPWLEQPENLDLLADALGLPTLEPFEREKAVGRFQCDLLCKISNTSDFLVVENQVQISDHSHLGQLVTYASGLEIQQFRVRYVAWLAEDFRDEHRVALDWLNRHFEERVGFFACRIEAWRIGASDPAPRFDVVVEPQQIAAARATTPAGDSEPRDDSTRVAYWAAFSDILRGKGLPLKLRSEPPRIGYYAFTINAKLGAYLYVYRDVAKREIGVYLSLVFNEPLPRIIFQLLQKHADAIGFEFGGPLEWIEVESDKNYKIWIPPIAADPLDETDWPRQHVWLVDKLARLHQVLAPRVAELPTREQMLASQESPPGNSLGAA